MADTITSLTQLQTLLADNNSKNISPQDVRDFLISTHLKMCTTTAINYSATANDATIILDASNSAISLTLPTCTAGNAGQMYMVKAINAATNKPYITNNVDGAAWTFGSSNEAIIIAGDGTNWKTTSKHTPGNIWANTTSAMRMELGTCNTTSFISPASAINITANFAKAFTGIPVITSSLGGQSGSGIAIVSHAILSLTTSLVTFKIANAYTLTQTGAFMINFMAVGVQ